MASALPKEKPDLTKRVHDVPHKPGVYLMRDRFNRVIYVGKARDLRKRVGSYFMPSKMAQADLKTRALLEAVWDFEFHTVASEPESLLLEGKLIKEYRPRYNISFRDDKRFLLVKVDPKEDWPRFRLARFKKDDGARYFGPYAHAGALRQTLNFMRKKFGVLTFGRGAPTERELKSSTYQVPFRLSEITGEQYRERVHQASDFLEGQSREMIGALEDEMRKAAEKLDFEKAAELRNMLEDLKRTTKPMRRFTRHSLPSAIDPASDVEGLREALQLPTPPVVMECFDISNISTTHVVASMVCFRNGVPDKDNYRRYRIRTVEGQDDFASMAEVVRRRYSRVLLQAREANPDAEYSQEETVEGMRRLEQRQTSDVELGTSGDAGHPERSASGVEGSRGDSLKVTPRDSSTALRSARNDGFVAVRLPDLVIVDGGKGQLSSACKELQRLGLHDLPIIGLAKEYEEIYRPGRALPLQLSMDSGALRLLQRIRDEAHRFANTYHQLLMKKRIGESILDDCPGVSQNRKNLLLRQFGSVNRLRKASVEQIASTEGIGPKLAEEVHRFLQRH
ncbi:MAG: Excinuclease ABC subunit C [uncultured Chthoniobacterales bacterium]|uniref:Excinuclease ABC subunit C n=1 Tax=uncultured Chthoniobacterales bacterium TaxID=1836801 RepID=A0A6J4IC56_9BACT|nr:MAG: Excinuclease ABC subunit C [uncultured Chthoniobacterales bacterium]